MRWLAMPLVRLFAGAFLISLSPVWVKLVDIEPSSSAFYRVFIGSLALAAYLLIRRQRLSFSRRVWWVLIAASVFFTLDLWFWHRSIQYVGPGLSTLLANFQVFLMMGIGVLFLRQPLRPMQLVAVPLAVAGLAMIVGVDWSTSGDYRLGVIFGLLTACAYAGYLLTLRTSRRDSTDAAPVREVFVVSALTAIVLAGICAVEQQSLSISAGDLGWMVGYGVLSHCVGWVFIASSLSHVSTTQAGLSLLLQPTLSFVWDVVIFSRPMTALELAGAAVAIVAIYLGTSKQRQRARPAG
jgi:drug/metabolite transporter (DMT)-like permease